MFQRGYRTLADLRNEIADKEDTVASLACEVREMPKSLDRDVKLELIDKLHNEIAQLEAIRDTI